MKPHEQGIIHRDLKPANVKVKDDGTVKVLDFALAKALQPELSDLDAANSPTMTMTAAATKMGVIMGTAAYMAPEQAKGRQVDKRADIWAFGVVLFEMLTGRQAYGGTDISETLAFVLTRTPDWALLPAEAPASVRRLLRRCLERDRKERLQHIGDARVEIKDALSTPSTEVESAVLPAPHRLGWWRALPWVAGLLVGVLVTSLGFWSVRSGLTETPVRKLTLPFEGSLTQFDSVAISPDGQLVAYTQNRRLWIQSLAQLAPLEVEDSDGALWPFWSPDSDFVGYMTEVSVKKVSAQGGPSEVLCPVTSYPSGGTWSSNDTIIFGDQSVGLVRVSAQGGEPRAILAADPAQQEDFLSYPYHLPGGQSFLFLAARPDSSGTIVVQTGDTRTDILSVPPIEALTYSPTGHILYKRGYPTSEGIWAVPFSLASLTVTGEPFLVADNGASPSVSRDGTLVYGVMDDTHRLVWVNRSGEVEETIGQPQGRIWEPTLSPDGSQVAVQGQEQGSINIWSHDVARSTKRRLTLDPRFLDDEPTWAPGGGQFAFTSTRLGGSTDIFTKQLDQIGRVEPLVTSPSSDEHAPNWSRDGKYLAYHSVDLATGSRDMWYLDLSTQADPLPLLQTGFDEVVPQISPDSRYLAFQSNELGRWEVFVSRFPTGEDKQPVSVDGGLHPRWSARGDELFYLEGNTLMAVTIETDPDLRMGQPTRLFSGEPNRLQLLQSQTDYPNYNVDNEGQRFIAVQVAPSESGRASAIVAVQNWFEEFRPEN